MKLSTRGAAAAAALMAGVALVGGTGTALASTAGSTTTPSPAPGCASGALPGSVVGDPGVKAGQTGGFYLWHGAKGYGIRVTHPGHAPVVFTGSVTASAGIQSVRAVRLEKGDSFRVDAGRHTLTFRFTDYGYLDGLNVGADCSRTVRVTLAVNGHLASPNQVFLGAHRVHPTSNPFVVERSRVPAAATIHAA